MTPAELERRAYITGDPAAGIYADLDDAERHIDDFNDEVKKASERGYELGRESAEDADLVAEIADFSEQLREAKAGYARARANLAGIERWFADGEPKKVDMRRACHNQLRSLLLKMPREVQQ